MRILTTSSFLLVRAVAGLTSFWSVFWSPDEPVVGHTLTGLPDRLRRIAAGSRSRNQRPTRPAGASNDARVRNGGSGRRSVTGA